MSENALPTLLDSSSQAIASSVDGNRPDSRSSDGDSVTPLMPSESLPAKEIDSGKGDGKSESKQKRKRTSHRDQATLEAEYKLNPKPNKAARAEIVARVDLSEKEVQIWFQNRRQIQRRKQRPLLPHEIAAFGLGNLAAFSSDSATGSVSSSSQSLDEDVGSSQEGGMHNLREREVLKSDGLPTPLEPKQIREGAEDAEVEPFKESASTSLRPSTASPRQEPASHISGLEGRSFAAQTVFKSFSSAPGYLANRWNAVRGSSSTSAQTTQSVIPTYPYPNHPSSCPDIIDSSDSSPPSSRIRMSLSLDGKAELTMSSPSPPRAIPLRRSSSGLSVPQKRVLGLQRSQSALAFGSLPQASVAVSYPPRLPAGRSRDVRSWQFACDTEARDELTTQAENESSGSAVAAISLLRSTGKSTLKSNGNKRNASPAKHDARVQGKKPRLREAHLSDERLQSTENSKPQISKGMLGLMHSPSGDSDKENWVPQEMEGNVRRRPLPSGRQDKQMTATLVLGDSVNPTTCFAKISGSRNRRRKAVNAAPKIFEDQENSGEFCEEVKEFMCKEVSPSKRGEFEGAQALLAMMGGGSWR